MKSSFRRLQPNIPPLISRDMVTLFDSEPSTLFEMKGKDARDFLHRLTTVNTNAMQVGDSGVGFFLTAQGKILCFFGITQTAEDQYYLDCPNGRDGAWKTALAQTVDRFTFAEKFTFTEISKARVWLMGNEVGAFAGQARASGCIAFDWKKTRTGEPTWSIYGDSAQLDSLRKSAKSGTAAEFEKIRIENARPQVDAEITLDANPLEIGMKDGIADQKGCYPGQEVIEKIIALGAPARGLVLVEGTNPAPHIGEKVSDGGEIGVVTSVIQVGSGFSALAIIRKTHLKEGLELKFVDNGNHGTIRRLSAPKEKHA